MELMVVLEKQVMLVFHALLTLKILFVSLSLTLEVLFLGLITPEFFAITT